MTTTQKRASQAMLLVAIVLSLSACKALRKKNKCNSCPTWDSIEMEAQVPQTEADDSTTAGQ